MDYKKKFKDYCKGKIKELEVAPYIDPVWKEEEMRQVLMTAEGIREFSNVRILDPNEDECLLVIDENDKVVINTPMINPIIYALRMEFNAIDTEFYNDILEYWDNINADEIIEDEEVK